MSRLVQCKQCLRRLILFCYRKSWHVIIFFYKIVFGMLYKVGWRKKQISSEKLSVILLNYARPTNIEIQLRIVLCCDFVDEVILSNNNPDCDLSSFVSTNDPRLKIISQEKRKFPSVRFELGRLAKNNFIVAIDDDLFPRPDHIQKLFESLKAEPKIPHGWGGEVYGIDHADSDGQSKLKIAEFKKYVDAEVDSLVWAFAFTKKINERYFQILSEIGETNELLSYSEDVPLSFSGEGPAKIHSSKKIRHCPTSLDDSIALHKQSGFGTKRVELVEVCRKLTGFIPEAEKKKDRKPPNKVIA